MFEQINKRQKSRCRLDPYSLSKTKQPDKNGHLHIQGNSNAENTIQRNILGNPNLGTWARQTKNIQSKKAENVVAFLNLANQDNDVDFSLDEINDFYEEKIKSRAHNEIKDAQSIYDELRSFIASKRDDLGAHGALNHAGTGANFIINRVNNSHRNNMTASYLKINEYLEWDTILNRNSDVIYKKYLGMAKDALVNLDSGDVNRPYVNAAGIQKNAESTAHLNTPANVEFEEGNMANGELSVEIRTGAVRALENGNYGVKIAASIRGSGEMGSWSVSKTGGVQASTVDIEEVERQPEAHTGGLAPEFVIDKDGTIISEPDQNRLSWVTKF
ncbi:hypothetical protein ACFFUP_12925 [Vibrio ostreicida]|uniref:Uncharacterized protein n=1 Tax=Vibrio ostreicida TaxID=526588 RepID=A0ABT8BXY4_9VIBR|nr:hypothetical protein [Vibrio ostreicida]MDN3611518.1 hypothetical protein [Vibrio ostreicida]NPD09013.1 hypothetical protein [Vibrio ostreicida]